MRRKDNDPLIDNFATALIKNGDSRERGRMKTTATDIPRRRIVSALVTRRTLDMKACFNAVDCLDVLKQVLTIAKIISRRHPQWAEIVHDRANSFHHFPLKVKNVFHAPIERLPTLTKRGDGTVGA